MIKLSKDDGTLFLACDVCGKRVPAEKAFLVGPFADRALTQPDDILVWLIHWECMASAQRIFGPMLLDSFNAVRAQPLLQPLVEKTDV